VARQPIQIKVLGEIDKFTRRVVIQTHSNLTTRTPVDTGLARSNWQISTGSARSGVRPITSQAGALSAAQSAVNRISDLTPNSRGAETIYIVNNIPYIGGLNRGKSRQAPAGYVSDSIKRAIAFASSRFGR
jgi:hypothetical protein